VKLAKAAIVKRVEGKRHDYAENLVAQQ